MRNTFNNSNNVPMIDLQINFVDGIKYSIISIVYSVIPVIIALIMGIFTGIYSTIDKILTTVVQSSVATNATPDVIIQAIPQDLLVSFGMNILIIMFVFIILSIIAAILLAIAEARFAETGNILSAFDIKAIFDKISSIGWGNYIVFLISLAIVLIVLGIVSGISAKNQNRIHNKFTNKTLAVISVPTTISCIIMGLCLIGKFNFTVILIILLVLFFIQFLAKGAFYTLIKRYLNNFTNSSLRSKITSAYNLVESIARAGVALCASWLLKITTPSNTVLVLGCVITIIIVLLLDSMRNKVGLKPEEYSKKDIEFLELH